MGNYKKGEHIILANRLLSLLTEDVQYNIETCVFLPMRGEAAPVSRV